MKKIILGLISIIPLSILPFGNNIWGQKEARFTMSVSSDTVGMNGGLEVTFTLENAQTKQFNPPNFDGFEAQGPSTASSMSFMNGDMSQKISYTYYLTPKTQGNFVIGKATVETDGKTLETESKNVVVVDFYEAPKRRNQNRNPFFNDDDNDFPRAFPRERAMPRPQKPDAQDKKKKYSTEKI
jgi:BatD DUF11 like domain